MRDHLTPQQRLANIVAEGEFDHEGFKPNHRMDATRELVKVGLNEFEDYIRAGHATAARRAPRTRRPAPTLRWKKRARNSPNTQEISPMVVEPS